MCFYWYIFIYIFKSVFLVSSLLNVLLFPLDLYANSSMNIMTCFILLMLRLIYVSSPSISGFGFALNDLKQFSQLIEYGLGPESPQIANCFY